MSSQMQDAQTILEEQEQDQPYQNPRVLELTEAEFQQWRHSPISQAFLLFLAHRSESLTRTAAEHYLAGNLGAVEQRDPLRGRIMELRDLCIVKLADIQRFYGVEPKASRDNASKNP